MVRVSRAVCGYFCVHVEGEQIRQGDNEGNGHTAETFRRTFSLGNIGAGAILDCLNRKRNIGTTPAFMPTCLLLKPSLFPSSLSVFISLIDPPTWALLSLPTPTKTTGLEGGEDKRANLHLIKHHFATGQDELA